MLNSYIRILTNNTDISNYAKTGTTHNVEISTYRLNEAGTAFVKLTDAASQTADAVCKERLLQNDR